MRKSRFTDEQVVEIIRAADREPVAEVAKRHGVSEQTIHTWRERFGELRTEDVRRLPAALLPLFEWTRWPIVVAAASDRGDPRQIRLDVGACMRSMWRWGGRILVQSVFSDEGPAGNPGIGRCDERPDGQPPSPPRHISRLLRPNRPKPP